MPRQFTSPTPPHLTPGKKIWYPLSRKLSEAIMSLGPLGKRKITCPLRENILIYSTNIAIEIQRHTQTYVFINAFQIDFG
jgi:hypothetical protein